MDERTLLDAVGDHARRPSPAILAGPQRVSYPELMLLVEGTARRLREKGVRPADRVLVVLPNGIEHVVAVLAVMTVDAIAVPLDVGSGATRVAAAVDQAAPTLALVDPHGAPPEGVPAAHLRLDASVGAELHDFGDRDRPAAPDSVPVVPETAAALIRFTSGSTGLPKGVVLGHRQVIATARLLSSVYGLDEDHRELILVSIAHSDGWQRVAATLVGGGTVAFSEGLPTVGGILDDVESLEATGFFVPPPLLRVLLQSVSGRARRVLARCRSIEIGSAVVTPEELRLLMAWAPAARVFVHYGLTECSRAVILDARRHAEKLATVGTPAAGVELKLVSSDGRPASAGQICLRGPQRAEGYWNRPELNAERFVDGWFTTGDEGVVDAQGFLTLRGRRDDMITSGGHHFFPAEVEVELGAVDSVAQYLIAGVPDPRGVLQEVPWAFVVPRDRAGFSPRGFLLEARRRLPPHMVPRHVVSVASLPLTPSGKPDRRRAVAMYAPVRKAGDG